ncbi:DUF4126 domain-containing protein [Marinilongibacter aquaticus]|uniref:DUF4126 domain-containing protein n=1 Tax=Marinilongibacter aquaticus TaxID=2975157 RepID=UPI0021BD61E4|nr:DUF4126 domain-containing protein [Marinilongibacter aquaticus]UBM58195.1 DUF4126 domain-containing protein [Marinilongibacter aquaticus]
MNESTELFQFLPSLCLGIALSAASGFRVFLPLLVANLAGKFGVFPVAENMAWLSDTPATVVLLIATLLELGAYYIPVLDNLLDTLAMPSAVVAGTLLTGTFLQIDDPMWKWGLALIAGGSVAGTFQAGTSLLRLGSTKFTGGLGNNILTSIENIFSATLSILAFLLPIFIGIIILYFVIWIWRRLYRRKKTESLV